MIVLPAELHTGPPATNGRGQLSAHSDGHSQDPRRARGNVLPSCTWVPWGAASITGTSTLSAPWLLADPPAQAILGRSLRPHNFLAHFLLSLSRGQLCPQPPPRRATDNLTSRQLERYLRPHGGAASLTQRRPRVTHLVEADFLVFLFPSD